MSKTPLKFEWIIIHCTATPGSMSGVDAAWVDRAHRQRGFTNGTGYNEVITRDGQRQNAEGGFKARPLWMQGAHVGDCGPGWNAKALGISLAGGVNADFEPEDNFTDPQWDALCEAVEEYQSRFSIPDRKVIGHRDLIKMTKAPPKACPCFSVQEKLFSGKRFGGTFEPRNPGSASGPLRVPEKYEVKAGDTLWRVSTTYGVPISVLLQLNPSAQGGVIHLGQTLRLR
jgi:N-acetylmuramoyl-L-alanine amidase